MRQSRRIRTRCGDVVVEHGRLAARRRPKVAATHLERPRTVKAPIVSLAGDLGRMLRGRSTFPRVLFGAEG